MAGGDVLTGEAEIAGGHRLGGLPVRVSLLRLGVAGVELVPLKDLVVRLVDGGVVAVGLPVQRDLHQHLAGADAGVVDDASDLHVLPQVELQHGALLLEAVPALGVGEAAQMEEGHEGVYRRHQQQRQGVPPGHGVAPGGEPHPVGPAGPGEPFQRPRRGRITTQ